MYVPIGNDMSVREKSIVGIFDLDNCSWSHRTREFLQKAEENGEIVPATDDLPKSFILTVQYGLTRVYLSQFSAGTIEKFFKDFDIDAKYKNKVLNLPGKVAVLKGELEARLPNWRIVVGTTEAIQLVRFLREFK